MSRAGGAAFAAPPVEASSPEKKRDEGAGGAAFPEAPSSETENKTNVGALVLFLVLLLLFILLLGMVCRWCNSRERSLRGGGQDIELPFEQTKKYTFSDLKIMTNNFNRRNLIGDGGFAKVYKGTLDNGTVVAVKRLTRKNEAQGINDFKNEVEALGRTKHNNLVKLVGYCVEGKHRMLVSEYISNGTLKEWIFGTNHARSFSWPEMKKVIHGIAKGLEYLHENCEKKIIHRDLKPANILIDENKNAKLCDFGISKQFKRDQTSSIVTSVVGTEGYVAPEVLNGERFSEKVDVYSFGKLTLEVLFGKSCQKLFEKNSTNLSPNRLPGWINKYLNEEMKLNGKEIERIGKLALKCLNVNPIDRPTMSDILRDI